MTALAWSVALASFVGYAVALQIGPSCANTIGPYSAGLFFASFVWLAYRYDRRDL